MPKKRSKSSPPPIPPILRACDKGDLEAVRMHLDAGVPLDIRHDLHPGLMPVAISRNWVDLIQLLIDRGYDLNAPLGPFQLRPLHLAAGYDFSLSLARMLVEAGSKVEITDKYGGTPLMRAVGNLELLELLISKGANLKSRTQQQKTVFMCAAEVSCFRVMQRLLELGSSVDEMDVKDETALHWAAKRGDAKVVQWLLEHGADRTLRDYCKYTPLDWARENDHSEVVKLLEQA